MEDAENFNLVLSQAIKNDEWRTGYHQFSRSFQAALPPQMRVSLQNFNAGKNSVDYGICVRGSPLA